jgi:hypothetical protein
VSICGAADKNIFFNKSRIKTGIDSNEAFIIIIFQRIKCKNGIEKVNILEIGRTKIKITNRSSKLYVFQL